MLDYSYSYLIEKLSSFVHMFKQKELILRMFKEEIKFWNRKNLWTKNIWKVGEATRR